MTAPSPWMKFYPQDWRADEKLRLCSLAARGLWIEMIALMHRSDRYGTLLVAGIAPTPQQLAMQVAAPIEEVETLLAELEAAGVFSRAATGAIYSRRMKKDEKKAKIARQNGKNGGNPRLKASHGKQTGNSASDKGGVKPLVGGLDKAQIPEARDQIPESEERGLLPQYPNEYAGDAPGGAQHYAFSGRTIRLIDLDLARWRKTYHAIPDIEAELTSLDAWLQEQPEAKRKAWFHTVSGALNRKHQEVLERRAGGNERQPLIPI